MAYGQEAQNSTVKQVIFKLALPIVQLQEIKTLNHVCTWDIMIPMSWDNVQHDYMLTNLFNNSKAKPSPTKLFRPARRNSTTVTASVSGKYVFDG